jgi:maltooligosyltrehalose trehalohydrolase
MLADECAVKAAVALVLMSPQIPLLFMGEEWGCTKPFNYFVSQEGELAEAIRKGRIEEFALAAIPGEEQTVIPDPCDIATYHSSIPEHPTGEEIESATWLEFYRELLAARHAHIIPVLAGARALNAFVLSNKAVKASWRMGDGAILTIFVNLDSEPVLIEADPTGARGKFLIETRADAGTSLREGTLQGFSAVVHLLAAEEHAC